MFGTSRSQFSNPPVKRWWTHSKGWRLWNASWLRMYGCFHSLHPSIEPCPCSPLSSAFLTRLEHPASAFFSLLGFLLPLRLGPFPPCSRHSDDLIQSILQPQISLTSRPNKGVNSRVTVSLSTCTIVPGTHSMLSVRKRLAITCSPLYLPPLPVNSHCQHSPCFIQYQQEVQHSMTTMGLPSPCLSQSKDRTQDTWRNDALKDSKQPQCPVDSAA